MSDRDSLWWRKYPHPGCQHRHLQVHPKPEQKPVFKVGVRVRLKDKPERTRTVLSVVWHSHCHEFVYVVETFKHPKPTCQPYWFSCQLISEEEWQRNDTVNDRSPKVCRQYGA